MKFHVGLSLLVSSSVLHTSLFTPAADLCITFTNASASPPPAQAYGSFRLVALLIVSFIGHVVCEVATHAFINTAHRPRHNTLERVVCVVF